MYHNSELEDAVSRLEQLRKDSTDTEPLLQKSIDGFIKISDEDKRSDKGEKKETVRMMPCETYSRVVGFFRPVKSWNAGKTEEYNERKTLVYKGEVG